MFGGATCGVRPGIPSFERRTALPDSSGTHAFCTTDHQALSVQMHAPPKQDVPVIKAADLLEADGFVFGFPTR